MSLSYYRQPGADWNGNPLNISALTSPFSSTHHSYKHPQTLPKPPVKHDAFAICKELPMVDYF